MTRVALAARSQARQALAAAGGAALLLTLGASTATAAGRAHADDPSSGQISKRVARAAYGSGGVEVDLVLVRPDHLRLTNQAEAAAPWRVLHLAVPPPHAGNPPSVGSWTRTDDGGERP